VHHRVGVRPLKKGVACVIIHTNLVVVNVFTFAIAISTTFNNGSLGSRIDEERSEMRYVM
jgi:hypothetical protein